MQFSLKVTVLDRLSQDDYVTALPVSQKCESTLFPILLIFLLLFDAWGFFGWVFQGLCWILSVILVHSAGCLTYMESVLLM